MEAFSEGLAMEVAPFGVRVRLVLPGRAPGTSFGAATRARSRDGIHDAYVEWAGEVLAAAPQMPSDVTTTLDVATAVWQAVTDPSSQFRIPAGSDAVSLAAQPA